MSLITKMAGAVLRIFGWRVKDRVGYIPKAVICVAPHTSNWDFVLGELAYLKLGRKAGFLMKQSWFFFPLGSLLRAIGGIPVNRSRQSSLTEQLAHRFACSEELHIAITPEGTRKRVVDWKKGFYFIAEKANVPILLATIDYARKEVEMKEIFYPTGRVEEDIQTIRKKFSASSARHPHLFASVEEQTSSSSS